MLEGVGDGDRRCRELSFEMVRCEPEGGSDSLLFQGRGAGLVGCSRTAFGGTCLVLNGVWLPVVKRRNFRPLRLSGEATAGARLRVDELALD